MDSSLTSEGLWPALKAAVEAKRQHVDDLLRRQNVVACGVGFKESEGQWTEEPCVVVSVTRKVPKAQLSPDDLVPQMVGQVKTDVQEMGTFRAWAGGPRDRHRPAVPGISIGHLNVTAGTFGCLVRRGAELFLLSNNHVLANTNRAQQGDPILQPGRYDGGTANDTIATLAEWIPLQMSGPQEESDCPTARTAARVLNWAAQVVGSSSRLRTFKAQAATNTVDCALARPVSAAMVQPAILGIGVPKGVHVATLGLQVQKAGRTTGYTTGQIMQVDVTVQVDYEGQNVTFTNQLMANNMSGGGDSGAAVLDMAGYVVGLLFGGSDMATLINPIQPVLTALNVQVVTS